jgi:hypothetical protein
MGFARIWRAGSQKHPIRKGEKTAFCLRSQLIEGNIMRKLLFAMAAIGLPGSASAAGPIEHSLCGAIAVVAHKANEGSGFDAYWRAEANRVLTNMTAQYKTGGRNDQQAEEVAFKEMEKVMGVIAEDPVGNYVEGLFMCKNFGLINFASTASK